MKLTNNQLTNSLINQQFVVLSCKSCQNTPLHLSRTLYKSTLFMQNKANLKNDEMNLTTYITKDYEIFWPFCRRKNKANQSQNKPNLQNAKMNVTHLLTSYYENFRPFSRRKNKANQSQFKPNFKPKLASVYRYWLCFSPKIAVKWLAKNNNLSLWIRK